MLKGDWSCNAGGNMVQCCEFQPKNATRTPDKAQTSRAPNGWTDLKWLRDTFRSTSSDVI